MTKQADPLLLIEQIEAVLPQTQCRQCGFDGCHPYAQAIVQSETINRCTPGGTQIINRLAKLLNKPMVPLHKDHQPKAAPHTVVIREEDCIGCTKCIQACPMDAIVGSAKQMHTVIASDCTGCDLCIPPCPVNCIAINPLPTGKAEALLTSERSQQNRYLFDRRKQRLMRQKQIRSKTRQQYSEQHSHAKVQAAPAKLNRKGNTFALKALKAQKRKFERQYATESSPEKKQQCLQILARLDKQIGQAEST